MKYARAKVPDALFYAVYVLNENNVCENDKELLATISDPNRGYNARNFSVLPQLAAEIANGICDAVPGIKIGYYLY
jgi:hypothetical protein